MGRPRTVDYDEVRNLYATGAWTQMELAEKFGVSLHPIRCALHASVRRYQAERQEAAKVPCANNCGNLVHGEYFPGRLCRSCWAEKQRTSVREDELHCVVCKEWKPDEAFPHNRNETHRRDRHTICRSCSAEVRQKSRVNRFVPCTKCGKPRTNPKDTGAKRRGLPDSGLCRACFIDERMRAS